MTAQVSYRWVSTSGALVSVAWLILIGGLPIAAFALVGLLAILVASAPRLLRRAGGRGIVQIVRGVEARPLLATAPHPAAVRRLKERNVL